jgi:hypothetical protein
MARTKPQRDPEYTLNIFRGTDPKSRHEGWIFLVRTVKEFVSFDYEILLSGSVAEHEITLQISGIHAPLLAMPGVGPAKGWVLLRDIQGPYTLTVKKLNKEVDTFKIVVGPEAVKLREKPPHPFIALSTEPLVLS